MKSTSLHRGSISYPSFILFLPAETAAESINFFEAYKSSPSIASRNSLTRNVKLGLSSGEPPRSSSPFKKK